MDNIGIEELRRSAVKGTTTVGVVCREAIVLAADKRAVAGETYFIADKGIRKIHKITDNILVTSAGIVSDIQLIVKLTRAELKLKTIRTKTLPTVKEAANLFASILYQNIRKLSPIIGITHFVVGGKDTEGFHLYEVTPDGSISEKNDYVASGAYGSIIGYGILEDEWRPNLSVEEGKQLAVKVVKTAIKRDASVGGGIDIAIVDKGGVRVLEEERIREEEIKKKK